MTLLEAHLREHLPSFVEVYDGNVPGNAGTCRVTIYGGSPQPRNRRYGGTSRTQRNLWQIVCVNTTRAGAVEVAEEVVKALDGVSLAGNMMVVLEICEPISTTQNQQQWLWSSTVEVSHYQDI